MPFLQDLDRAGHVDFESFNMCERDRFFFLGGVCVGGWERVLGCTVQVQIIIKTKCLLFLVPCERNQ